MSSGGVTSHQSFPINARRWVPHSGMDMSWWMVGVVLLFSLTRRVDTKHKAGAELHGELRSMTTNHNAAPYCVIRQTLLYLELFSLSAVRVHDGGWEQNMKTGMKVPPNTRECYEDRLCFVGRALKRYEASHIDRRHRHTPTEEWMSNVCTLCL
jgi:hypothetical protein